MARSRSGAAHALEPKPVQIQADDALADRLPTLRLALEQQHRFRSEQLASLVEQESEDDVDPSEPEDREASGRWGLGKPTMFRWGPEPFQ
jgi:hypothetical protein